ncbi:AAA family ATPase [Aestuariicella hydrocarbonica]|uniref:AAA family ATPase n=1 Tax=Pseudomaricurvus hydrocarbonicus TaxID=1470433 RepID=A0A9E5T1B3_9GAMM|nr:AAA family ATPase [Aestuariicella hydrocarbonica]NHO67155.1 AAA family ATPase [Aestuariicella hydrocarbonica]
MTPLENPALTTDTIDTFSSQGSESGKTHGEATTTLRLNTQVTSDFSTTSLSPVTIQSTGLSERLLTQLCCKHLYEAGMLTAHSLSQKMALGGAVVDEILQILRRDAIIEVRPNHAISATLRYGLTERGRASALEALAQSGYIGPAPVPLQDYQFQIQHHSIHRRVVDGPMIDKVFANFVIDPNIKDQIGMAVNSGRAIFIYGPAGSGKTYTIAQLPGVFGDHCAIPYAIAIDDTIIEVFDPLIHEIINDVQPAPGGNETNDAIDNLGDSSNNHTINDKQNQKNSLLIDRHRDPRWLLCKRPVVLCGGELTMDMLDIQFNPATRQFQAPLQLKANGGIFIIDDMGRQKPSPAEIFNRWIVPMEEKRDFLTLGSGRHFEVPFDQILIFSSNLNPLDLADEAFLRRIGYKIRFDYLTTQAYQRIWESQCHQHDVPFNPDTFAFLLTELHQKNRTPLLPCHPRDLLGIARDHAYYHQETEVMTTKRLQWAWNTYFVDLNENNIVSADEAEQRTDSSTLATDQTVSDRQPLTQSAKHPTNLTNHPKPDTSFQRDAP